VVVMGSMGEGKENEDDKGRACAHVWNEQDFCG
jgi:hypothetical protein